MQIELLIVSHLILLLGIYCKVIYLSRTLGYRKIYQNGTPIASNGWKCILFRVLWGYSFSLCCWTISWLIFEHLFTVVVLSLLIFYQMIFLVVKRTNGQYLSLAALRGYYRDAIHFKSGGIYKKGDFILLLDFSGLLLLEVLSADQDLAFLHIIAGLILIGSIICFAKLRCLLPSKLMDRLSFASLSGNAQDVFIAIYGIPFFQIWSHFSEKMNPVIHSSHKKFSFSNKTKLPGILLIEFESLDSNVIGLSENSSLLCPALTRLSKECLYFPYSLSLVGSAPSADAYVSQYNSICPPLAYPLTVRDNYYFPNSIISELGKKGYDSSAIFGFSSGFSCTVRAFQRMGFKKILSGDNTEALNTNTKETFVDDEAIYSVAMEQFHNKQEQFFCHLSTTTTHSPWKKGRINDGDNSLEKCYLRCLRKSDQALGEFLRNFRNQYPEVFIIIVGDHGPAISSKTTPFTRTKIFGHTVDFVPLMIIEPTGLKRCEKLFATTCLDVLPTIADIAGGNYLLSTVGQSLVSGSLHDSEIDIYGAKATRSYLYEKAQRSKMFLEKVTDINKNDFEDITTHIDSVT